VAVFQNGKVDFIANEAGSRIIPSIVSFGESELLIADSAKHQMTINPTSTICSIKRLMGRRFNDMTLQDEIKRLPYKVVNQGNRPFAEVLFKGETKLFSPEEISAMILSKMKTIAEDFLGRPVKHAVVIVPAYFNDAKWKSTINAGQITSLHVLRILNGDTPASRAYGLDMKSPVGCSTWVVGGSMSLPSLLRTGVRSARDE
jgi:heat shock protein 5